MKHGDIEIQKNQTNIKYKEQKERKTENLRPFFSTGTTSMMPLMPRFNEHAQRGNYIQFQSPSTKLMSNTAPPRARTNKNSNLPTPGTATMQQQQQQCFIGSKH